MEKAEVGDSLTPLKCNRNGRERSGTSWTVLFARRTSPWRVDELSKRGLGVVQSEVAWPWPLLTRNQDQIAISQKLQILGTICSGEITGIGWECLEYFSLGRTHTHMHTDRVNFFMVLLPLIVGTVQVSSNSETHWGTVTYTRGETMSRWQDVTPGPNKRTKARDSLSKCRGSQELRARKHKTTQRICKRFATHRLGHAILESVTHAPKVL